MNTKFSSAQPEDIISTSDLGHWHEDCITECWKWSALNSFGCEEWNRDEAVPKLFASAGSLGRYQTNFILTLQAGKQRLLTSLLYFDTSKLNSVSK